MENTPMSEQPPLETNIPMQSPVVPVSSTPGALAGMSVAAKFALVVVLVAAAAGIYVVGFRSKTSTPSTPQEADTNSQTPADSSVVSGLKSKIESIDCAALATAQDVQAITGDFSTPVQIEKSSTPDALCSYRQIGSSIKKSDGTYGPLSQHIFVVGFQAINQDNAPEIYDAQLAAYTQWYESAAKSSSYPGVAVPATDIPGLGARASTLAADSIGVLSSNRKYVFAIATVQSEGSTAINGQKFAKLIDASLSKF